MKNYYSVLGVLPTVELVVIKAAYRALCQMYHPDKYDGDKVYAEGLLKSYNEAWSVLSDIDKRNSYDEQFTEGTGTFGESTEVPRSDVPYKQSLLDAFPDLKTVAEYYPDIWEIIESLQHISRDLATGFVATLFETKAFNQRLDLAEALESRFFASYFGRNKEIIIFAKQLVGIGEKEAALELNHAVNVFGDSIEASVLIPRIDKKYGVTATVKANKKSELEKKWKSEKDELRQQGEREAVEKKRKNRIEMKRAMRESISLLPVLQKYNLNQILAASRPIRLALNISMTAEKSGTGLLSFFSDDVLVFRRENREWRVQFDPIDLGKWISEALLPIAVAEFGMAEKDD